MVEVQVGLAGSVHHKFVTVHQRCIWPPVGLARMVLQGSKFHLVPEAPLQDALYTGHAEHQPEEILHGNSMLSMGHLETKNANRMGHLENKNEWRWRGIS